MQWHAATFAEMGYIVILPNITGSTGFGLDFARSKWGVTLTVDITNMLGVNGEWGGKAYQDLLNLLNHLETIPYLDQDKAVFAGASYSGYLASWFMGHDIIKKVRQQSASLANFLGD